MKNIIKPITLLCISLLFTSCDKDFEEINTNPYALTEIDPALLFSNAQRLSDPGFYEGEQTIVQQYMNAYNTGATAGFNFNEDNNNFNAPRWNNLYPGPIKLLEQIISLVQDDPQRVNLYSQARIWRAYNYMTLVDTYGDIPYDEAGKAFLEAVFYPKYNDDQEIYNDLIKEIKEALAGFDSSKNLVREDLFFGTSASAGEQVDKWKKVGNSLLLRIGMRYSKLDPDKAKTLVQEAFSAGVMTSNDDNVFLKFNAIYNNQLNAGPRGVNPYFYYLAEPFVDYLKNNRDPRLKYIAGKYSDPNQVLALTPDTTAANQFGFPVGYDQTSVINFDGYRGPNGTGQNYSQLNFSVFGSAIAPVFYITNAQTSLLLAEASFRGWISGGMTPKEYYEKGIRAALDDFSAYPNTLSPAISSSEADLYLAQPAVQFSDSKALEQINTQYWVLNFGNGTEAFANFRRSGFPTLQPNKYNNNLNGGFTRRFPYPNEESARNSDNYLDAVSKLGQDNLSTRVFWDVQ